MSQILSELPSSSVSLRSKYIETFDTDISSRTSSEQCKILNILSPASPFATEPSPYFKELGMIPNLAPISIEDISRVDRINLRESELSRPQSPSSSSVALVEPTSIHNNGLQKTLRTGKYFKWLLVLITFVVNFIIEGLQFSISVFLEPFKKEFNSNTSEAAWVVGIFLAMPHLAAPVASLLINRFGCRKMTIVGSFLTSLGVGLSSQVNSLLMIFVTYGVIGGFGLGMIDVASNVVLAQYFDNKLSFASGLSVCGTGIGTLVLVPSIDILIKEYGWRHTNVLCAGIYLFIVLCGLFFRPVPSAKTNKCKSVASDTTSPQALTTMPIKEKWHKRLQKYFLDTAKSVLEPLHYNGFLIFAASNFIFYLFNDIPYVYPLDSAMRATWLIVIISICNVVGQIYFGWLGDKERYNCELLYAASITLCGLSVLIMPLVQKDVIPVSITTGLFGFFVSGNYALTNIILRRQIFKYFAKKIKETIELEQLNSLVDEKFSSSYGLLLFIQGIGNLFGPPLAGSYVDRNAEPDMAYYLGGVAIIVSGVLVIYTPLYDCFHPTLQDSNQCVTSNQEPLGET